MDLWANAPSIICGHVSLEPLSYYSIIMIQWLYEHRATTLSLSYHMVIHWTNGPYSLHYDHMNHLSLLNCHCVNVLLVGLWAYHTTDHTLSSGSLPRWPCLGSYLGLNLLLEYMISIRSSQSHSAIEYVSHSVKPTRSLKQCPILVSYQFIRWTSAGPMIHWVGMPSTS